VSGTESPPTGPVEGASAPKDRPSNRPSQRPGGAASLIGTTVSGRYRIDSVLGEGGMGTVYAAEHTLMRKRVAIKVLHPDMGRVPDMVARFEREAMAAGHIDHPNIAAATDFGQLDDGSLFLVLEYVEGENLRLVIERGRFSIDRALHIGRQIVGALSRAHALGVVHRDLKPDNVMLITRDGDPDFVKVLDFGIAKVSVLDPSSPPSAVPSSPLSGSPRVLTQVGMIYGTPEYMAPEQALGQPVDGRADLYAVGILLFEMLTGRRPFDHDSMAALLGMHVAAPVPQMSVVAPDADVPPAIEAVVRRLLAKNAADRYASADELKEALARAVLGTSQTDLPPAPASAFRSSLPSIADANAKTTPFPAFEPPAVDRTKKLVVAGVVTATVLGLLGIVLVATSHSPSSASGEGFASHPAASASSGSGGAPAREASSAKPEGAGADPLAAAIATADAALAKGEGAKAIATIAPLEAANAGRTDVHRILEHAYALTKDRDNALREADAWLALDATATSDLTLQGDVGAIATHPSSSEPAIDLLASRMGAPGVDILYDLAFASQQAASVSRHARAALLQPHVRAHAGPAAAVLLDLRAASTCEEKKALLPRAKADGDKRALALLQPLTTSRTSGACMRGDDDLPSAIAAVRGRNGML
jgi:serine/threonine protein kinase